MGSESNESSKTLNPGIATYADMKARTLAIARGERRRQRGEPRIWVRSMESFAKMLSERNQAFLTLIAEHEPESLAELAGSEAVNEEFDRDGAVVAVDRDAEPDSGAIEALDDDECRHRCGDTNDHAGSKRS